MMLKSARIYVLITLVVCTIIGSSSGQSPSSVIGCDCTEKLVVCKPGNCIYFPIGDLVKFDDCKLLSKWRLQDNLNGLDSLYYKNLRIDNGQDYTGYDFTAVSFKYPIILIAPKETYRLNLTPCSSNITQFEVPINLSYSHWLRKLVPDLNYKTFDKTFNSYFILLTRYINIENLPLIKNILDDYKNSNRDLEKLIHSLNTKYLTNIRFEKSNTLITATSIVNNLKLKKINISQFIASEFAEKNKQKYVINEAEKRRLENIFKNDTREINIDKLESDYINPTVQLDINVKKIAFIIDSRILSKWNGDVKKSKSNNTDIPKNTEILADISELHYSTKKGLAAKIDAVCVPVSEITGTKILIAFDNAKLISPIQQDPDFNLKNYPLFKTKPTLDKQGVYNHNLGYTSQLTNFNGLFVKDVGVEMTYKKQNLNIRGKNFIINNNLISGQFDIAIRPNVDYTKFYLYTEKKDIKIDINEFKKILTERGFKVEAINTMSRIIVYFKKTAS